MEIIALFVGAIEFVLTAGIAMAALACIALVSTGVWQRKWWLAAAGVIIAVLPLALHWWSGVSAERAYAARMAAVAKLKRHPLPADYPRTAVVLGNPTPMALEAYLLLGYLDAIKSGEMVYSLPRPASQKCRAAAYGWLQGSKAGVRAFDEANEALHQCRKEEIAMAERPLGLPRDAIVIRRDQAARHRDRTNGGVFGGIVEIALRRNGQETLIDYAEKPRIGKSASALLPITDNLDTGPSPDPDRMIARMFGPAKPVPQPPQ